MDVFLNVANVLYLFSYLVKDILWLRILTIIAATTLMPYFYFQPEPLMTPIYWNLSFTVLNLFWVIRLILERRPVTLTGHALRLYQLTFRSLKPREMLKLLKLGQWQEVKANEHFIVEGDQLNKLMLICEGKVRIVKHEKTVEKLTDGQFIGGESFCYQATAPASVIAEVDTWYMSWPKDTLLSFLRKNPQLQLALQLTLGFDLTQRLQKRWLE